MANNRTKDGKDVEREFDQTQLKMAQFKHQAHKDYLGHIFRWGFASTYVNNKMKVLDVGCGQEMPFARSLGGANPNSVPELYVGCDLNKISSAISRKNFHTKDEFNFITGYRSLLREFGKFDIIVNFEVFEHMQMRHGRKMLKAFRKSLSKNGKLIFSMPVYSDRYKMARNHINELRKEEIEKELHSAGFKIIQQFGTFCNWHDLTKVATKEEILLQKTLGQFYSNDLLGCFLSPKYPEAARNITHICVLKGNDSYEECELKESNIQ
jgi:2-polyprenyl-3-methyl-5-hydroxy-6-metoxy-1,4-benzoquinol methylase